MGSVLCDAGAGRYLAVASHGGSRAGARVIAQVNWSRRFEDPVPMPDGSTILTVGEAAQYATSLPTKIGKTGHGRARPVPSIRPEHGGPFVFIARISFYRAVHGDQPPPVGNPEGKKGHRCGKRKLARDR